MAKTFRQAVEEIQCDLCNWKEDGCEYKPDICPVVKVTTARIFAAHDLELERIAKGMKDICPQTVFNMAGEVVKTSERQQREADQAYLLAERSTK